MNPKYACFLLRIFGFTLFFITLLTCLCELKAAEPLFLSENVKSHFALWLSADARVQTNAHGLVPAWMDQSPNGNHAFQTNPVSMPKWISGVKDQPPFLRFNGTNFLQAADSPSLEVTNDFSLFVVLRMKNFSSFYGIMGKGSGKRNLPAIFDFYVYQATGRPLCFRGFGSNFSQGILGVELDEWSIVSFVAQGTNMATYLNGFPNGRGNIATDLKDKEQPVYIGSRATGGMPLDGDLAEVILCRSAMSDEERAAIHQYLGKKYGVEMTLDIRQNGAMQRFEGQTATFSASVLSASPIRYQWQKNGVDIPNATDATYTTPALTSADNNSVYRVKISSPEADRYGNPVAVSVVPDTEPLTATTAAFLLRDQSPSSPDTNENSTLPPYSSRLWQPGEDSLRNTVQAIAQTSDGFLWVGTHGGIARFDGQRFEFISLSISSNAESRRINALCTTDDGSLWAGGNGGLFQLKDGQWTEHSLPVGSDEIILSLCSSSDGSVWIGTRSGLALCKNNTLSLPGDSSTTNFYLQRTIATQPIRSIFQSSERLWLSAGTEGIVMRSGQPVTNHNFAPFKPGFIRSFCPSRDGSTWAGGNSGLIRVKEDKSTHYSKVNGLPDNTVTGIYEDRRGNLWIGTYGGLCRFANGKFVTELTPEGEPYDQVLCFFEDRENNLWVGAKNGLYQLNVQQFITYTTRHGLAHNNVISVYEDNEGAIWIGTWGGGLHCLRGGKITIYTATKSKAMRNDLILALQGAYEGGIWFGEDYDGGLYRLHNGQFDAYGKTEGLGRGAVRTLLEDNENRLWIGTASSYLSILENDRITSFGREHGLPTNFNRCLLQTQDGRIWAGTEAGLCFWTNGGFVTMTTKNGLSHATIHSLYEDKEQNLWIGTSRGINRLKATEHSNFTISSNRGETSEDAILEILEDDFENFWLATRRGVLRVAKSELEKNFTNPAYTATFALFGKADGMASPVCVGVAKPSALKTKDGRLWFATTKGLAVTDPKLQIARNEKSPAVIIRVVFADKKALPSSGFESGKVGKRENNYSHFPTLSLSPLLIPPGRGELEFHYIALSYTAPEKNQFKYKLEGLDSDWIEAGTRREAYYNNVPPGNYTFRVIACNNDGVWNSLGSNINLTLQPHFWQTIWFKSFTGFSILVLVSLLVRYATRKRMQLKLERLEQQHAIEKERTRIAQDMHDELGSRLTEIAVLSTLTGKKRNQPEEVMTQSNRISNAAAELIDNLHTIVWSVNPANDILEKLVDHLRDHAASFLETNSIRCAFRVPSSLPPWTVSSEARHHLFMAVKEALTNIAKHAAATEVCISISTIDNRLLVQVSDNGKGFEMAGTSSRGNGLLNMEDRLRKAGGRFGISSEPGKGTQMSFEIPLGELPAKSQRF